MKKITKILTLLFIVLIFSCEDVTTSDLGENSQWVQFESEAYSISEASPESLMVPVLYASSSNADGIDINFSYTASSTDGFTISPSSGILNFPAGEFVAYIEITPINDTDENSNILLDFSFDNNSVSSGVAGEGVYNHMAQVTIIEDDCSFTLEQLGDATWSGFDNAPSSQAGPNNSQITSSYDDVSGNLLLVGIGYAWLTDTEFWDEVVTVDVPIIVQVDLLTGAILIEEQFMCTTTWLGDVQPDYSIVGTGEYLACSNTMILSFDLIQGGGVTTSLVETITF